MHLVAHPRAFGEVHCLESHPARLSHHAGPEPQKAPGLVDGDVGALRLLHAALALLPEAELHGFERIAHGDARPHVVMAQDQDHDQFGCRPTKKSAKRSSSSLKPARSIASRDCRI